jgi:hypothetical protein
MIRRRELLGIGILAVLPRVGLSCSCIPEEGRTEADRVRHAFRGSDAVILVDVVSVRTLYKATRNPDPKIGPAEFVEPIEYGTLSVLESWKGPHKSGSVVATETNTVCCACGLQLETDRRMLLYLLGKEPYGLDICSRFSLEDDISTDRRVLDGLRRK